VRTSKLIVTVLMMLGSAAAVAGPYCVLVDGMAPDCRFYDQASCAQAAVTHGGGCIDRSGPLGTQLSVAPRDAAYCLVGQGDAKCFYFDAQSCAKAAEFHGGTCITRSRLSSPTR
jgi:hypothetical protein